VLPLKLSGCRGGQRTTFLRNTHPDVLILVSEPQISLLGKISVTDMPCSTISLYLGIYILNIRPKICPSAIVPTEAKGLAYSRYYLLGGWMSGTGEAVI
jgi:hypothetical protein